jgi:hypothetical protein
MTAASYSNTSATETTCVNRPVPINDSRRYDAPRRDRSAGHQDVGVEDDSNRQFGIICDTGSKACFGLLNPLSVGIDLRQPLPRDGTYRSVA